jgi:hypothetical protein
MKILFNIYGLSRNLGSTKLKKLQNIQGNGIIEVSGYEIQNNEKLGEKNVFKKINLVLNFL